MFCLLRKTNLYCPKPPGSRKSKKNISKVASDERVKDEIMDIFYDTPFYGVPRLTAELKRRGFNINHKRVRRLQKALGLRTIYPRPHFNTSYAWFLLAY